MKSRFAVIGLGRFGGKIARQLARRGAEVVAIDDAEERVEALKEEVALAITLDATDLKALKSFKIDEMDAVVVAIGENFEALVLTVVNLLELKIKRIIARAGSAHQKLILEKLGVMETLSPEEEVGILVAERLIHPSVKTFLQLPDGYEIAEINAPKKIWNKTIADIEFESSFNLTLITVKRLFEIDKKGKIEKERHLLGVVLPSTIIYENDEIIVMGKEIDIERFIEVNN
ncbi:MAG: TrkA family potassium uptake protein [Bacteroidota bacterium]|nr:TrkA family potassium uptake protein [Bacteroidota bacterium]